VRDSSRKIHGFVEKRPQVPDGHIDPFHNTVVHGDLELQAQGHEER
jgi:hypothetical protein